MLNRPALIVALTGVIGMAVLGGCRSSEMETETASYNKDSAVGMRLEPTNHTIAAGEIVTVAARTQNLLGRDAEVRWLAPGGELHTEQSGRLARVKYDHPGTYTITSQLFLEGREAQREQLTIRVNPAP